MVMMTVKELLQVIQNKGDSSGDLGVKILLDKPSLGVHAYTPVTSAYFGFDWDSGLLLKAQEKIVEKTDKQELYERSYNLLMFLATVAIDKKQPSYPERRATHLLLDSGVTLEDLRKYKKLFHKEGE